jgi:hypothetical protein
LLGDEPALSPELRFYQRLLARDPDEATELAEEYLEDEPLEKLYDGVVIPALGLAEQDRLRGSLDRAAVQGMAEDTVGIVEYLMEEERDAEQAADTEASLPDASSEPAPVLCIGARNALDEAAAAMLVHLLTQRGLAAATVPRENVAGRNLSRLPRHGVRLVCLSYLNPRATQHAHRLTRRLRHHFGGNAPIMVGLWMAEPAQEPQELLDATGADLIATSLRQAVREVQGFVEPARADAKPSAA